MTLLNHRELKKSLLNNNFKRLYSRDAEIINFWRKNPVIACEDLLGIYLTDAQAWILASSWNTSSSVWSCCRNYGKSFLIAVYCILRALLYPNQNIYIISSVGQQAVETFEKLEQIVLNIGKTVESIPDVKDIAKFETVASSDNKTGFSHPQSGHTVSFYNGSSIKTLNSKPDNIRGKRASLLIYDEGAFCVDELIIATEPFTMQKSDTKYGSNTASLAALDPRQPFNQTIYASSQDDVSTLFYKRYKDYAKRMIAGDRDYFVCDMPCDTGITVYQKGKQVPPLIDKNRVDAALKNNPDKARREYYNKPDNNGGVSQIVKWSTIRNNEKQLLPYIEYKPDNRIVLAFDPARTLDNSILSGMQIYNDENLGLCGDIISCTNFIDIASKKKYKLDSNRQIDEIREIILAYNGDNPDYSHLDMLLIDSGSGGGGLSTYADQLMNDFIDKNGIKHKGLIDKTSDVYSHLSRSHPNAIDKLRLINPKKWRSKMVEEFIELMELGVIRFPLEFLGGEFIKVISNIKQSGIDDDGKPIIEEEYTNYKLSVQEQVQLTQIELMKQEITSIHKFVNNDNTNVTYALPREKANRMHDDRFYTILLLAHRLYELRRGEIVQSNKHRDVNYDIGLQVAQIRPPKILQDIL